MPAAPIAADNVAMTVFYWVMGLAIAGTLAPSALCLLLFMATGEPACGRSGFADPRDLPA